MVAGKRGVKVIECVGEEGVLVPDGEALESIWIGFGSKEPVVGYWKEVRGVLFRRSNCSIQTIIARKEG